MLSRMAPSSPPVKRTLHLLKTPDILLTNDNRPLVSYHLCTTQHACGAAAYESSGLPRKTSDCRYRRCSLQRGALNVDGLKWEFPDAGRHVAAAENGRTSGMAAIRDSPAQACTKLCPIVRNKTPKDPSRQQGWIIPSFCKYSI